MISSVKLKFSNFFNKGHERSLQIRRNMFISLLVKGGSVIVGLVLIPMTISYISTAQYGIWLTISSIINWISFFDIGLGNGLKNKLATSAALGEDDESNKYVSTTYAILLIIASLMFIVFNVASTFVNWNELLNISPAIYNNLQGIIIVVLASFCIQFVVQTITVILTALQQTSKSSIIAFIGQLGILVAIFILKKFVPANLMILVITLTGIPILVFILSSIVLFTGKLKQLAPKIKNVDFKYAKTLFNVGGVFFIIQIGALVLFQTDNFIIIKILGPKFVTTFNVSYKLFSSIVMVFYIVVTPYWSAFTDAYAKKDFEWIKTTIKKMRWLWVYFSSFTLLVLLLSKYIYALWLGKAFVVPSILSIAMAVYVIVFIFQTIHVYMLNGIGKIKLQLLLVVISAIINIPLAIYLGKNYGLAGIISANTAVFLVMGAIFYVQCNKIIYNKAKGIWNA